MNPYARLVALVASLLTTLVMFSSALGQKSKGEDDSGSLEPPAFIKDLYPAGVNAQQGDRRRVEEGFA